MMNLQSDKPNERADYSETSEDIPDVKLAIDVCHDATKQLRKEVPIIVNVTLDQYGKILLGTNIQAAYTTVSDMGIDVFGLNCSTGPAEMTQMVLDGIEGFEPTDNEND